MHPHSVATGIFVPAVTGGAGTVVLRGDQVPAGMSAGCEGRRGRTGRACRPGHVSCPAHPQPWTLGWRVWEGPGRPTPGASQHSSSGRERLLVVERPGNPGGLPGWPAADLSCLLTPQSMLCHQCLPSCSSLASQLECSVDSLYFMCTCASWVES